MGGNILIKITLAMIAAALAGCGRKDITIHGLFEKEKKSLFASKEAGSLEGKIAEKTYSLEGSSLTIRGPAHIQPNQKVQYAVEINSEFDISEAVIVLLASGPSKSGRIGICSHYNTVLQERLENGRQGAFALGSA